MDDDAWGGWLGILPHQKNFLSPQLSVRDLNTVFKFISANEFGESIEITEGKRSLFVTAQAVATHQASNNKRRVKSRTQGSCSALNITAFLLHKIK